VSEATKKKYHKGCFGGSTRADRERARQMRLSAHKYARNYVRNRVKQGGAYARRMEDPGSYQREIARIERKRLKVIRAKAAEKRTGTGQKR